MAEAASLLSFNDLTVDFQKKSGVYRAVDHVSFDVKKGETLGIVGESGSGKTVSVLSALNLLPSPPAIISSGNILFKRKNGKLADLIKLSHREMKEIRGNEISMVFQEPMSSLNPVYTCGNQVVEIIVKHLRVNYNTAKKQTLDLFDQVQLPRREAIFNSYPHQISGGQKQRVMIAMAMACNPEILIADEPTTALDATVQKNILNLIHNLQLEHNMTVILISHDLGVIGQVADRVLVMYKGQIVEQGNVWDIYSDPQHPYTKGLLACRPRLDLKLKVLPTVADFMHTDENGIVSEKAGKYRSVGEAILFNAETSDEILGERSNIYRNYPILEIDQLKVVFPVKKGLFGKTKEFVKAVDDVSFKVYPGETLGLVGESGCGKTTLGRAILHLVKIHSGSISWKGRPINELSVEGLRSLRKDIQIIFQDPYSSLNPRMTIGEAIMEPMKVFNLHGNAKSRKDKAIDILERVNLSADSFDKFPFEFSGGQRQRVSIARTLAVEPSFIICDESVSALDVSVQAQVLNLLNELKNDFELTYIFISHDLSVVKFVSDRVMVMNNGKIIEEEYPDRLFQYPQKEYTKKLIDSIPLGGLEEIRKAQLKRRMAKNKLA